jgi:hypothetical protein
MSRLVLVALLVLTSNASAQPTWRELSRARNEPPQLEGAGSYFDLAPPAEGTALEGTLVCRLEIARTRSYDGLGGAITRNYGAPDPTVTLHVGRRRFVVQGPEDAWRFHFSVPNVTLRRRDRVAVRVVDRDVAVDDPVGDAAARFAGRLPIVLEGLAVSTECRRIDPAELERRLPRALANADSAIAHLTAAQPSLDRDDLGAPGSGPALDALYDAAALVGWEHPEVARRRLAITAAEQTFARALAARLAEADAGAPDLGVASVGSPWTVRVLDRASCEPNAGRCRVRVELTTDGPARLGELRFDTVRLDGRRHGATLVELERDGTALPLGNARLARGTYVASIEVTDAQSELLRIRATRGGTRFVTLQ